MIALLTLSVAVATGRIEHVEVTSDGTPTHNNGPPDAAAILAMRGAELGAAVAKWATEELDDKALMFACVSMLGSVHGTQELDAFVDAADGEALPAIIATLQSQTCDEQGEDVLTNVVQGALGALGTLATGGVRGTEWKESSAGLSRCTWLAKLGALNATVFAMGAAGFSVDTCSMAWQIQQAGLHVISSVCLGHDGKEGLGLPGKASKAEAVAGMPSEANFRREAAADAGAIEVIISVLGALRDCDKCGLKKKDARALLDVALRALQRVLLGHDAAGSKRRARAAAGHAIPAMVGALDKVFTSDLMEQVISTNFILMEQDDPLGNGKANPALDQEWQSEIAKRPSLGAKMQEVMMAKYMADPAFVRKAHQEAGFDMPEGL